ncbi:MAG: ETC complex I subunit [Alphaproteobacteria bacterium]|nr:ETC complex I subunit [Alphaproteobacteria bacterium]MBV8548759.1 ETC complex I subunit [Alphaproteobacteria bacterium]
MRVRIYRPSKTASQSGRAGTRHWLVEPELATPRTPEALMGWQQSGDTLGELGGRLKFASREEAVQFATARGWDMVVEEPAERHVTPRNYLDNFKIVRPQDEERQSRSG